MQSRYTGLIIRESNVGENDRIVTILTAENGVMRAFAKGSKKIKSRLFAGTRLFTYGDFVLYSGHDKYIVTEAARRHGFFNTIDSIEKLSLAQYVCELTAAAFPPEQPDETNECLSLVLNTLHAVETTEKQLDLIKGAFELRLMMLIGYCPDVSSCAECGQKEKNMVYYPSDGILRCPACAISGGERMSEPSLAAVRYVLSCPPKRLFSFSMTNPGEFALAAEKTVTSHLERDFKTLSFYHSLRGNTP